jgi:hypothetical protein
MTSQPNMAPVAPAVDIAPKSNEKPAETAAPVQPAPQAETKKS